VSNEDVTIGIAALGAPIFDYRGRPRAAISISGIRAGILGEDVVERMIDLVVEGAREISASLGHDMRAAFAGDA
jgi:DNA-binding IclR family transcriptional regulator